MVRIWTQITSILVIICSVIMARATTTVSGTLLTPSEVAVTSNAYARLELKNYGTNLPRVLGSNVVLPSFIDLYPDGTGDITTTLTGNELINPGNTWYNVTYFKNGKRFYECDFYVPSLLTGTVSTSGTTVTWVSGTKFPYYTDIRGNHYSFDWVGSFIIINAVTYTISSVDSATQLTLTTSAGVQASVSYSHGANVLDLNSAVCLNALPPSAIAFAECPINCPQGPIGPTGPTGPTGPPGTGSGACDNTKTVDIYVATTGSNITGDGTVGNPYLTIQHAIDTDVPDVVDGKYYIHLAAGTYTGAVDIGDRLFPAGSPEYTECTISDPCSQLYILGDTSASETYIVSGGGIKVRSGSYVTLQGIQVQSASYGLIVSGGAAVTLRGVIFKQNTTHVLVGSNGFIFIDPYYSVDDAGFDLVSISNDTSNTTYGVLIMPDGLVTDFCDDGSKSAVNSAALSLYYGAFGVGTGIEVMSGSLKMRNPIYAERSGFHLEDGTVLSQTYDFDGQSIASSRAITMRSGTFTGSPFTGGNYSVTDADFGIVFQFGHGSIISNLPYDTATFLAAPVSGPPSGDGTLGINLIQNLGSILYDLGASPGAAPNFSLLRGVVQKLTLNINAVMGTIAGQSAGARATWMICQPAAGGPFTFAFNANFKGQDTIGVVANKCNIQSFWYDGTTWWATGPMQKDQ